MAEMMRAHNLVKVRTWHYAKAKGSYRAQEKQAHRRQLSGSEWYEEVEGAEEVRATVDFVYRFYPPELVEEFLESYGLIDLLAEYGLPLTRLAAAPRTPQ